MDIADASIDFDSCFSHLTGCDTGPFPWQQALFAKFQEKQFPETCDIPTGLGKTSILAIWLLGLAHHARAGTLAGYPRRLVYVVNRRTVVDQATREAEQMRKALDTNPELNVIANALRVLGARPSEAALAISTLRGQFADNAEWRDDPARPAVIVGTVDMIGSRLLFSGYGRGFKSRPLHAAFLGQDVLLSMTRRTSSLRFNTSSPRSTKSRSDVVISWGSASWLSRRQRGAVRIGSA
jgi:CRISPR-associated endonuclease/helicase Cas3